MPSVYKGAGWRHPEAMKRAALIGIISLAGLLSLWLLLAWLGKTESNYRQPRPGMRFENKGDKASAPETIVVYQPRHFADGEVGHYQVRMEKGFLKMPAGKVTFAAQQIDHNGTTAWQFTLKGGALGGLVLYDARSIVNAQFTHALEYHTVQKDLASRNVVLQFDPQQQRCHRQLNGNPDGVVDTEPSTFDPLSIIFKFRELDLARPGEFDSAVCDGKATFQSKVTVVGREEIQIGDKNYKTILVEPDLGQLRGVFQKDPDAKLQIWLSDDSHRAVLRIRTKVKHGTFIADLADYQRPE